MKLLVRISIVAVVLVFINLFMNSCGKLVADKHSEFIGLWEAFDGNNMIKLEIKKDSYGVYSSCNGTSWCEKQICCDISKGKVRIQNDCLVIKLRRLAIDMYPQKNSDGNLICRLNGVLYTKSADL